MNLKNKIVKEKIYEAWAGKIKKHFASKGIKNISEAKLRQLCEASQVRKLYENATLGNTPGRGAFSFGNNPSNSSDTARGSGEQFDHLFGVFIDTFATTIGMDMIPVLQMSKSNLQVNILEPIYAGGKLESTTEADMPEIFMVKMSSTGAVSALVVGQTYQVKDANAGDNLTTLTYVGKDRTKGYAIWRIAGVDLADTTIVDLLDTATNGAGIYTSNTIFYGFVASTVQYVNAYTNWVSGFSGAGQDDTSAFTANRSSDKISKGMSRNVGEGQKLRSMGLHKWSENFSAETYQVKIGYTIEMLQDLAMEEGVDSSQVAFDAIANELEQSINDEVLDKHYGLGWGAHADLYAVSGVNLNLHIAGTAGSAQTYVDEKEISRTLPATVGALAQTTNGDNLPAMQRRIVSRIGYGASAIGQRSKKGKGNVACTNGKISSSISDIRSFQPAPFDNDLKEGENLYQVGSFKKIALFEDPLMPLEDNRVSIGRKGTDNDPGLKMMTYIMGEKLDTIAEGTMSNVTVLKSRMNISPIGTNPALSYLTLAITEGTGQSII